MKHLPMGGRALSGGATVSDREQPNGRYHSRSLTDSQRIAADFRPGSHLEVGEFVKRRICPSDRLEGATVTSRLEPFRESSVDPRYGLELLPQGSGMSEYPAGLIQSRYGNGPRPK